MKKKGFTLIELLAVIVILAIIALIATPIVMNIIENSKKGAAARSADNYLRAVETAVAAERIESPVLDGEYTVDEDGNLVLGETTITVETNGEKPAVGSKVKISNGLVDKANTTLTISGYPLTYNTESKAFEVVEIAKLCTLASDSLVAAGEVGAKYICDPGDGIQRTFYILENGSNPVSNSTLASDEVALIMNGNIEESSLWCVPDVEKQYMECEVNEPVEATNILNSRTRKWTVEVALPTYDQLYSINNSNNLTSATWLYENSYENLCEAPTSGATYYGYWTATYRYSVTFNCDGRTLVGSSAMATEQTGIRPVIIISKTQLG